MATHNLKSWPKYFQAIKSGHRCHELRLNDRNYQVNDLLCLEEWFPETQWYSGWYQYVVVTAITSDTEKCAVSDQGLSPGYCIMTVSQTGMKGKRRLTS